MAGACCRALLLALLLPCMATCALLPAERDLPVVEFNCSEALPRGYEVRATLRVAPAEQDFLLALRTASDRTDLALLTAQGVPVYRISCFDDRPLVSVQTPTGDDLPPMVLLTYLAMIFMDSEALSQHLQPDWVLQEQASVRVLKRSVTAAEIRVDYQGTAPWFSETELVDSLNGVTLRTVILEGTRVLPE